MFSGEFGRCCYRACDWTEEEGYVLLQERRPANDWGHMSVRWIKFTSGQKEEWSFTYRLFSARELAALMREARFPKVLTYGDLRGSPHAVTLKR